MGRGREKYSTLRSKNINSRLQVDTLSAEKARNAWNCIKLVKGFISVWMVDSGSLVQQKTPDDQTFLSGKCYLILSITGARRKGELNYDIFMWIGKYTVVTDYTFLAYNTVELDKTMLQRRAVHHRETQNNESAKFLSLFPSFIVKEGGMEQSVPVIEEEYDKPKMYRIASKTGLKDIAQMREVKFKVSSISSKDCYIIEGGKAVILFWGKDTSSIARYISSSQADKLQAVKKGRTLEKIDEVVDGRNHEIFKTMPNCKSTKQNIPVKVSEHINKLVKVYKIKEEVHFLIINKKELRKSELLSSDVFIVDSAEACFVWIGEKAEDEALSKAMFYASSYLESSGRELASVIVLKEGAETSNFWELFK